MPNTNESPKVSVIIPTHNRATMLKRAIESVLAQSYQDFELIIVSDGATDETDSLVEGWDDRRIRYFKHAHSKGASAARNTGIKNSRGAYLAFLDDDDEWLPFHLESLVDKMDDSEPKVGLVYGWIDYYEGKRVIRQRHPTLKGKILKDMLDKQAITNSSVLLIRREVLDIVKGFDEELPRGNDGDFIRRISKHFEVDYVPKVLAKIHVGHADRITVNSIKNLLAALYAIDKRLEIFAEDFKKYPDIKTNLLGRCLTYSIKAKRPDKAIGYFFQILRMKPGLFKFSKVLLNSLRKLRY
jgi:glycosyltransferase involved in cell wall biosynthesis